MWALRESAEGGNVSLLSMNAGWPFEYEPTFENYSADTCLIKVRAIARARYGTDISRSV
ncbi:hypothetical protein BCCR75502_05310 [Burkholderia sola]|uniref:Uncharacterized protein n=1 Tax=Burkholderia lata (strain ATCC 17760 / DSM 23089 / LMG 22485 / NCIMB 9086 / R18194 / 383) TaxID=482957 RepID=A0A6P2NJL5_BURL3|nr:hypothetical protein BCCR75389_05281 [Burkholderia cenocepacia]VWB94830.1 hypothetical protein BLA23254_04496 [Burkholderia lata]CAG2344382.1 hypothetical protein BCCR75388_05308 [Burkholderia cenocepacia]CAG2344428.1 hypothetical protein BCCR75384_05308 [Burkholderia cenocepacia]CAG2344556.1 hypothetical protein BCCR75386_05308 [Burkholderia cenocepacia]